VRSIQELAEDVLVSHLGYGSDSDLMIRFDPYHNVDESQRKQVLGGQVSLWAEQVSPVYRAALKSPY
jgi:hypothetical protein